MFEINCKIKRIYCLVLAVLQPNWHFHTGLEKTGEGKEPHPTILRGGTVSQLLDVSQVSLHT